MFTNLIRWAVPAILLSLSQAHAYKAGDLIGSWDGNHKETVNGKGRVFDTSLYGSRDSEGTIRLLENLPSWSIKATYLFKKNGSFSCKTLQGSKILSSYSGKWNAKNDVINISASGTDGKLVGTVKEAKKGFVFTGSVAKTQIVIKATEPWM